MSSFLSSWLRLANYFSIRTSICSLTIRPSGWNSEIICWIFPTRIDTGMTFSAFRIFTAVAYIIAVLSFLMFFAKSLSASVYCGCFFLRLMTGIRSTLRNFDLNISFTTKTSSDLLNSLSPRDLAFYLLLRTS